MALSIKLKKVRELFPYPTPTSSQVKMMEAIALAKPGSKILVHNSTGAGKTIAVLAAALARMEKDQKIIVFCRTISQISSFLREWKVLLQPNPLQSLESKKVPFIMPYLGKKRLCRILDKTNEKDINIPAEAVGILCHMLPCNFHPSKTSQKPEGERYLLPTNIKLSYNPSPEYFRTILFKLKQDQCPYYMQHSMLKVAKIIVTTYSYLWEPLFSHMLQSLGIGLDNAIIVVDEAHNLANTVRETITMKDIAFVQKEIGNHPLISALKESFGELKLIHPSELGEEYMWNDLEHSLDLTDSEGDQSIFSFLSSEEVLQMKRFLRLRNSGYIVTKPNSLTFIRVSPDQWLSRLSNANLQVYMSGTFRPLHIFAKMFGFNDDSTILMDLSLSNPENIFRSFLSYRGLTSKVTKRTPTLFKEMAKTILELVDISPRHSMVVCPSYAFQEKLVEMLQSVSPFELIVETKNSNLHQVQKQIDRKKGKVILVAISSGKFSEGIQLVRNGKSLLSLLIFAGLPFATPSEDQKFVSRLLANVLENPSFVLNFEQIVPLMQLITQALGRTVRSSVDKGALAILDYRAEMFRGLDKNFVITKYTNLENLKNDLSNFFNAYPTIQEVFSNQ